MSLYEVRATIQNANKSVVTVKRHLYAPSPVQAILQTDKELREHDAATRTLSISAIPLTLEPVT